MSDDERRDANGKSGHESAAQAARAAAAAAAVGAALGAVRALATRGDEDDADADATGRDDEVAVTEEDPSDDAETEAAADVEERDDEDDEQHEADEPTFARAGSHDPRSSERRRDESRPREGASSSTVRSVVARAREQLHELQGRDPESVTALERIDGGWRVTCEVVELERIPNSTDVLATYVVELDGDGELLQLERIRRYYRAQADIGGEA
jgi:hypothetical protein